MPQLARCRGRPRDPPSESRQRFLSLSDSRRRMHKSARNQIQILHAQLKRTLHGFPPPGAHGAGARAQCQAIGNDQGRGASGRGRARIGDEVADRKIGLVADAADNWNARLKNRQRYRFFVECPQVLDRAAAATEDQHIHFSARVRGGYGRNDARDRDGALHGGRIDDDRRAG